MTSDNEGWIKWEGGECPVAEHTRVEARLRNGRETKDAVSKGWHLAGQLSWKHFDDSRRSTDIIAYRIVNQ